MPNVVDDMPLEAATKDYQNSKSAKMARAYMNSKPNRALFMTVLTRGYIKNPVVVRSSYYP